jgi:hypothetical protein
MRRAPRPGRAPDEDWVTSILQAIANARLALLLDGEPLLVIPVPVLAAAVLLPVAVALLAAG